LAIALLYLPCSLTVTTLPPTGSVDRCGGISAAAFRTFNFFVGLNIFLNLVPSFYNVPNTLVYLGNVEWTVEGVVIVKIG
jgi:hypothetical protein